MPVEPAAPLVWIYADAVCDLFHYGHIEFFRLARSLGDRLVVGLVSDRDAASYKPAPIMTFEERVAVVRACREVDRVLDTPAPLHCTRKFLDEIGAAYCCHADDMDRSQLEYWYHDIIPAGRLKVVSYTAGISTTQIVARVARRLQERPPGAVSDSR